MANDVDYLLADEALQLSASEGPMRIEEAWCLRVRMQGERVGRSRRINRKERVERNGAGAFLVSIDRRYFEVAGKTGQQSTYGYFVVLVVEGL